MPFPRSFKSRMWFVELPTRNIEFFKGTVVERAFHTGLLDKETSVRSVDGHWTSLGEAAGFEPEERISITNLFVENEKSPEHILGAWAAEQARQEQALRAGASRFRVGMAAAGAIGLVVLAGCGVTTELASRTASLTTPNAMTMTYGGSGKPIGADAKSAPIKCTPDTESRRSR